MNNKKLLTLLLITFALISCKSIEKNDKPTGQNSYILKPCIIYKTTKNYYNNVPVTLSNDKKQIVSYPAISDIYFKEKLAYPYKLNDNYLLDNRGINNNVAFLKLTYEEYSKLKETPTANELYELIIDKNPLEELYNCGARDNFKNEISELNTIIDNKQLYKFKKLK